MDSAEGFEVESVVTAPVLKYNQPGITYTLVQLPEDNTEGQYCTINGYIHIHKCGKGWGERWIEVGSARGNVSCTNYV